MKRPGSAGGKRWIRPLPERVVNKIAAGEVIERPAAVLKELVENALDAGANRIDITAEQAGIKLLKIVDNGCGIPAEQIEIAFSRHATSKISTFDDLDHLYTYGFRGEALPSIASVSRLRMVSRPADQDTGMEILFEGGVLQSSQPIAAPPGTSVEVEDLFFNTPARRKFLKSESTEARHLARTATALALANPETGFSYRSNDRELFVAPPEQDLRQRITELLGRTKRFVEVVGEVGPLRVRGFIGTPDMAQHNRYGCYLFINGRYIYSATLLHALRSAYGEMIIGGAYPIGALLLEVDPATVDVNVHPSKTEVRLANERALYDSIRRLAREALRQDGIIPVVSTAEGRPAMPPSVSKSGAVNHIQSDNRQGFIPGILAGQQQRLEAAAEIFRQPLPDKHSDTLSENHSDISMPKVDRETGEITEDVDSSSQVPKTATGPSTGFRYIGRLGTLYLLLQAGDDLFIVDQHTAHERVLYEQMQDRIDSQTVNAQTLLFPVQVELNPEQLALFEESHEALAAGGFVVSPFGGRMVNIEAVPAVLSRRDPELVLTKVLDDILSLRKSGYDLKKAMAQSIACRSAVMSGDRLNDREAEHLLERLLQCRDKYSCPHGRPTFVKVTRDSLDKQFGRA